MGKGGVFVGSFGKRLYGSDVGGKAGAGEGLGV
jgi:ATP-dependent Zn protease